MKRVIFLLVTQTSLSLVLIFYGCNSTEDENKKNQKIETEIKLEKQRKNKIDKIVYKYDIKYLWDTLSYDFSINYYPILDTKLQLIDEFSIDDIFVKDTTTYVRISFYSNSLFNFTLKINRNNIDKLLNENDDIILIVNINEIEKMSFSARISSASPEEPYIYIGSSNDFIGNGEIVEIEKLN